MDGSIVIRIHDSHDDQWWSMIMIRDGDNNGKIGKMRLSIGLKMFLFAKINPIRMNKILN